MNCLRIWLPLALKAALSRQSAWVLRHSRPVESPSEARAWPKKYRKPLRLCSCSADSSAVAAGELVILSFQESK